jgi:hypothetical protein
MCPKKRIECTEVVRQLKAIEQKCEKDSKPCYCTEPPPQHAYRPWSNPSILSPSEPRSSPSPTKRRDSFHENPTRLPSWPESGAKITRSTSLDNLNKPLQSHRHKRHNSISPILEGSPLEQQDGRFSTPASPSQLQGFFYPPPEGGAGQRGEHEFSTAQEGSLASEPPSTAGPSTIVAPTPEAPLQPPSLQHARQPSATSPRTPSSIPSPTTTTGVKLPEDDAATTQPQQESTHLIAGLTEDKLKSNTNMDEREETPQGSERQSIVRLQRWRSRVWAVVKSSGRRFLRRWM